MCVLVDTRTHVRVRDNYGSWVTRYTCENAFSAKFPVTIGRSCIMPRRRNKVLVEWLDRSCKGETNRVNMKHIIADAEDITVGAILMARMNSRRYKGVIRDLLEWSAPKKSKRKSVPKKSAEKAAPKKSTEKKEARKEKTNKVRICAALKSCVC